MNRYSTGLLASMGLLLLFLAVGLPDALAAGDASPSGQATSQPGDKAFSREEFAALSPAAKQDIYLKHPQLLPPGFTPQDFPEVMQLHEPATGGPQ